MSWATRAEHLFNFLLCRRKVEEELDQELHGYFCMLVDRHLERGLSLDDAQRAARMEFEGLEQVKEKVREVHMGATIESMIQDVRYAWRSLRKSKGFSSVAVLTLALGIGVNAAIFSVVYAVLLRPLPYDRPEQLALIWSDFHKSGALGAPTSGTIVSEIQQRSQVLQDVAGVWAGSGTFTGEANPEQVKVAFVTPNFLQVLGVRPLLGRIFTPEERSGGRPALVLSYGSWRRRFGGDPAIVGKGVAFQGVSATVVGVLPEEFRLHFPPDSNVPADVQAFMPFQNDIFRGPRTLYYIRVLARLKPGVSVERAQEDLTGVATQIRGAYTEFAAENLGFKVVSMHGDAVRDIRPALVALFTGAGFVLLICCVNVANLLLARASDRRKEIALRVALGASRGRLLRQLLTEGTLLCGLAGLAGVMLAWAGLRGLVLLRPQQLARMDHVELNWPVLVFAAAIALASVLLFGLAPGIESGKWDLMTTLREAGRNSQTTVRRGLRSALIVCEITLGFILVIGAGLMIRTLLKIQHVNPGFEPQHLLTFEIDLPFSRYRDDNARRNFVKEWEAKLKSTAGVETAGAVSHLPLGDYPNWYSPYRPQGVSEDQAATLLADHRCVTPGYLQAMGTRLLEGRYFDEQDRFNGRQVVIVDELLAQAAWPGQSAIGKKIEIEHFDNGNFQPGWTEVVGVVEHIRNHALNKQLRGEVYIPYEQSARPHLGFAVRTHREPLALAETVRRELRRRDQDLAISNIRPMTAYVQQAQAPASFTAVLAGIFAGLALLLAAIGIYGVISYSVSRRSQEMGVRMALGASSARILSLVMKEGLSLAAIGIALGTLGSLALSRYLTGLIYGVAATDVTTYAGAITVIAAAALLGCWRPARKAAAANPVDALRAE